MKNRMILILSLVVLVFSLVGPVWAASTGTINVTVTPKLISLSVTPTTYDYGTLGLSDSAETTITFTVENDGTVAEDFDIKGFDTADWTLSGAVGADTYKHDWKEGAGTYAALTTGGAAGATSVAAGNSKSFRFRLNTPTSSGATNAQSPNVTFTASES